MEKIFSDFRFNKHIRRTSIDSFIKELDERVKGEATVTLTTSGNPIIFDEWDVERDKEGVVKYHSLFTQSKRLKTTILNLLVQRDIVAVIIICHTGQKYKEEHLIKEIWGYRLIRKTPSKIFFNKINHEELYEYCTKDFSSGKNMPPQEELVYCGPDGKICGWDMV